MHSLLMNNGKWMLVSNKMLVDMIKCGLMITKYA